MEFNVGEKPLIGILHQHPDGTIADMAIPSDLSSIVEEYGGRITTIDTDEIQSQSFILAYGEPAFRTVATMGESVPVIPIGTQSSYQSVSESAAASSIASILNGEGKVYEQPVLRVKTDNDTMEKAIYSVTLATKEPATISEFSILHDDRRIGNIRADGITIATPAGSYGYARAAGGPVLDPLVNAVAVVPIAPFVKENVEWVVPIDRLTVTIDRDEGEVSVQIDNQVKEYITSGQTIQVTRGEPVQMLTASGDSLPSVPIKD